MLSLPLFLLESIKVLRSMFVPQGAQHLSSLFDWVQGLTLAHLEPLLEPCRNFVVAGMQRAMDEVPAFQQLPELQRLSLLWLQYVAPLVLDNEVEITCKGKLLKDVQSELKTFLVELVRKLLNDVKVKLQRVSVYGLDYPCCCGIYGMTGGGLPKLFYFCLECCAIPASTGVQGAMTPHQEWHMEVIIGALFLLY